MADDVQHLTNRPASEVLRDTDRDSVGVVRILSGAAGRPGEEREFKPGDEALVDAGRAEWVVAPVHLPSAGRRLDHDAEREALPRDGVEVYPPAEPTSPDRRVTARVDGSVKAHSADGLAADLADARADIARDGANSDGGDAKLQAALGGSAARSGPVTAAGSDLTAADLVGDGSQDAPAARESSTSSSSKSSKA